MDEMKYIWGNRSGHACEYKTEGVGNEQAEHANGNSNQAVPEGMASIDEDGKSENDDVVQCGALVDDLHGEAVDREDIGIAGHGKSQEAPQRHGAWYGDRTGKSGECSVLLRHQGG